MNPIFRPDLRERMLEKLTEFYRKEVYNRTGKEPSNMDFFQQKLSGLAGWLCGSSSTKRGLIIGGSVGIGKTTITAALRTLLNHTTYYGYVMQMSAKYVGDYYRFRDEGDKWSIYTGESTVKRFGQYPQPVCKILFIDDLGMEEDEYKDYGTKTQPMAKLLHDRYERGLITIVSTNFESMATLREKYDDRIMDRLNSYAKMFYQLESFRR